MPVELHLMMQSSVLGTPSKKQPTSQVSSPGVQICVTADSSDEVSGVGASAEHAVIASAAATVSNNCWVMDFMDHDSIASHVTDVSCDHRESANREIPRALNY